MPKEVEPLLVLNDRYYMVGRERETGLPVLVVTVTAIAWRDYHFRITEEELQQALTDPKALDDLAERLAQDKGAVLYTDRLLE